MTCFRFLSHVRLSFAKNSINIFSIEIIYNLNRSITCFNISTRKFSKQKFLTLTVRKIENPRFPTRESKIIGTKIFNSYDSKTWNFSIFDSKIENYRKKMFNSYDSGTWISSIFDSKIKNYRVRYKKSIIKFRMLKFSSLFVYY